MSEHAPTSDASSSLNKDELAALWGKLSTETAPAKWSAVDRVRHLSGMARVVLVLGLSSAVVAGTLAIFGTHEAESATGLWQRGLAMVPVLSLGIYSLLVALRGYHHPQRQRESIATALALLLPLLLGAAPWFLYQVSDGRIYSDTCLSVGLSAGALASFTAYLMQRSFKSSLTRALASAAFGGLVALFTLELHCPSDNSWHLVSTHAMASVVLAGSTTLLWALLRTRRRSRTL